MVAARCPSRRAACPWPSIEPPLGHRSAEPPPHLQAVPSLPWPPWSRQSPAAAQPSGDRRARARARNLPGDRPPLLRAARSPPAMSRSLPPVVRVACLTSTWWSGRVLISARSTLTKALPSSDSERGNRSRLASERAASGEILRRAPRTAYVSVSTDIDCPPWATSRMLPNM